MNFINTKVEFERLRPPTLNGVKEDCKHRITADTKMISKNNVQAKEHLEVIHRSGSGAGNSLKNLFPIKSEV